MPKTETGEKAALERKIPTLADLFVLAMENPRDYWGDVKAASVDVPEEHFDSLEKMARRHISAGERHDLRDMMMKRMMHLSSFERRRLAKGLQEAKRYELGLSFVESTQVLFDEMSAGSVADIIQLALAPAPTTWIEYQSLQGEKFGFLIERFERDDPARWSATIFFDGGQDSLFSHVYVASVDVTGCAIAKLPEPYEIIDPYRHGFSGDLAYAPLGFTTKKKSAYMVPSGYENAFALSFTRLFLDPLGAAEVVPGGNHDGAHVNAAFTASLQRSHGFLKLVIATLAVWQAAPMREEIRREATFQNKGRRLKSIGIIPFGIAEAEQSVSHLTSLLEEAAASRRSDPASGWKEVLGPNGVPIERTWRSDYNPVRGISGEDFAVGKKALSVVSPSEAEEEALRKMMQSQDVGAWSQTLRVLQRIKTKLTFALTKRKR